MATSGTYEVSQNDLRELRRVFEWLADFAPKYKIERELKPKLDRRAKLALFKKSAWEREGDAAGRARAGDRGVYGLRGRHARVASTFLNVL